MGACSTSDPDDAPSRDQHQVQMHWTKIADVDEKLAFPEAEDAAKLQYYDGALFDAHLHVSDHFGQLNNSQQVGACLRHSNVRAAAVCMNQYVKKWGEREKERPVSPVYDLYPMHPVVYADFVLLSMLSSSSPTPPNESVSFFPLMSSFDLTDKNCVASLTTKCQLAGHLFKGVGQLNFRRGALSNLVRPRPFMNDSTATSFWRALEQLPLNLPVVLKSNATSMSTKKYAVGYEYIPELLDVLTAFTGLKFLWVDLGIPERGDIGIDYLGTLLPEMLSQFANLFVSITSDVLSSDKVDEKQLVSLAERFQDRVLLGTTILGDFGNGAYGKEVALLRGFSQKLSGKVRRQVEWDNAVRFFDSGFKLAKRTPDKPQFDRKLLRLREHLQASEEAKAEFTELSKEELSRTHKHTVIDCHMHLLDFLQKSSGTRSALQAMSASGVSKAVLFGMPCCKKWCCKEPQRPLYYQDDNGECYVYAYGDQMVADAWLALDGESRTRFAPMMASFNPTDLNCVEHVRRMYDKYPTLWRGIGEVMCRHDDLSSLLQDAECPTVNHKAMDAVYEFCVEKGLPVLVHHNSDRVADSGDVSDWQYTEEVEDVLKRHPKLRFVWVHAGVSRRVHEHLHHEEIARVMGLYPNLMIDISWVVWEDVICDVDGKVKEQWLQLIEKFSERVFLGSDQVGQFVSMAGENIYGKEIVKYHRLLDRLSKGARENVAFKNAQREYFDGWEPKDLAQIEPTYPCEYLNGELGCFVKKGDEKY